MSKHLRQEDAPAAAWVLHPSAVIALLRDEPGAALVWQAVKAGATISAVNLTEVLSKMLDKGTPKELIENSLFVLGLEVLAFDAKAATHTAWLRTRTRSLGLSLGDRACLALAQSLGAVVLTADRPWLTLATELGLDIRSVRPDSH